MIWALSSDWSGKTCSAYPCGSEHVFSLRAETTHDEGDGAARSDDFAQLSPGFGIVEPMGRLACFTSVSV